MATGSLDYYQDNYQDYVPPSYDDIHPGYQFTINKIREVAQQYLSPHQRRVVDVGCGPGILLVDLQRNGFNCLGIDFNPNLVRAANEQFKVPAKVGRVEDLAAMGQRFDLALLSHVLEHVDNPVALLRNIRDILDPGGIVIIELPNRQWYSPSHSLEKGTLWWFYYPPHHVTFWSIAALVKVLSVSGYSIIECIPRPFDDMNRIETFLSKRLKLARGPLFSAAVRTIRATGRLAGLQGGTLHAVARRLD
jgi:2-polyprenyl-3-methyl-5-hydroxy-6-metoxy-1,4-benzoquinol methylase